MSLSLTCRTWITGCALALAASLAGLLAPSWAGAAPGDLLVLDKAVPGGTGALIRVDAQTGARIAVSTNSAPVGVPGFGDTAGIALTPAGEIFVLDADGEEGASVMQVDPETGTRTFVSYNYGPAGGPDFAFPRDIAIAADGALLIADPDAFADGRGGVIRVDPETGVRTTLSSNAVPVDLPQFTDPASIAVAPNGDVIVLDTHAFGGTPGLIRVDPETGARSTISTNGAPSGGPELVNPVGLAVAANGEILLADGDGAGGATRVVRVDPQSGVRTTVTSNIAPFGEPSLVNPRAVAPAANGDLMVADADAFGGPGGVIRVDPLSGARTDVSRNGVPPGGPSFSHPSDIAVEAAAEPPTAPTPPTGPATPASTPPLPADPPVPADTLVPQISSLWLTNRRFRVGNASTPVGASRAPVGTRFAYTLSEPAAVTMTIERVLAGRRVGRRCLRPTPRRRKRLRCVRFAPPSANLVRQNAAGPNRIRFTGRTALGKLRPGRYRARIHATDAAGNRSATRELRFQVVRG